MHVLTKKEAAKLYKSVCENILSEIVSGRPPHLSHGLCRLITDRTDAVECDFSIDSYVGYAISREVMTSHEYSSYLGQKGVWTAERLGFLCSVVAATPRQWLDRVNAGSPS